MIEIIGNEAKEFPSSIIASKANSWIAWLEKQGEQERELGIHHTNISNCCLGKYKTSGGYKWKYLQKRKRQ